MAHCIHVAVSKVKLHEDSLKYNDIYITSNYPDKGDYVLVTTDYFGGIGEQSANYLGTEFTQCDNFEKALDYAHQDVVGNYVNVEKLKYHLENFSGGKTYEEALEKGLLKALNLITC